MGKGTALVAYFLDSGHSYIWTVSHGTVTALRIDVGSKEIGETVADYRHAVGTQQEADIAAAGKKLTSLLIQPVLGRLSGIERLYIVPSMSLHYLPFSSLPLPGGRFFMEAYALSILPSGSSLFFLDKEISGERNSILALGNPQRNGPEPPQEGIPLALFLGSLLFDGRDGPVNAKGIEHGA